MGNIGLIRTSLQSIYGAALQNVLQYLGVQQISKESCITVQWHFKQINK